MTDLISRQAAIDAYGDWYVEEGTAEGSIGTVKQLLEGLPSAEPEIIHCKDCEYYHPSYCEIWSRYGTIQTREAGYCYMAERRTDGKTPD